MVAHRTTNGSWHMNAQRPRQRTTSVLTGPRSSQLCLRPPHIRCGGCLKGEPVKLTVFWVSAYLMADRQPEITVNSTLFGLNVMYMQHVATYWFSCKVWLVNAQHYLNHILQIQNKFQIVCAVYLKRLLVNRNTLLIFGLKMSQHLAGPKNRKYFGTKLTYKIGLLE